MRRCAGIEKIVFLRKNSKSSLHTATRGSSIYKHLEKSQRMSLILIESVLPTLCTKAWCDQENKTCGMISKLKCLLFLWWHKKRTKDCHNNHITDRNNPICERSVIMNEIERQSSSKKKYSLIKIKSYIYNLIKVILHIYVVLSILYLMTHVFTVLWKKTGCKLKI